MRESGEYIFEFEATSGGPCRELVFDFESPPVNAACALLLLLVMAEAEAEAVKLWSWGFKNPARGFTLARLELISIFTLKTTTNN